MKVNAHGEDDSYGSEGCESCGAELQPGEGQSSGLCTDCEHGEGMGGGMTIHELLAPEKPRIQRVFHDRRNA